VVRQDVNKSAGKFGSYKNNQLPSWHTESNRNLLKIARSQSWVSIPKTRVDRKDNNLNPLMSYHRVLRFRIQIRNIKMVEKVDILFIQPLIHSQYYKNGVYSH